jgi:hypothetical protein
MPVATLAADRLQEQDSRRTSECNAGKDNSRMKDRNQASLSTHTSALSQLLTALLEHNPFLGSLDPKPYRTKLVDCYQGLKATLPVHLKAAQEAARADAAGDEDALQEVDQAALSAAIAEAEAMENIEELSDEQAEFMSNVKALKFSQSALDFIEKFEYANEACQGMLLSSIQVMSRRRSVSLSEQGLFNSPVL